MNNLLPSDQAITSWTLNKLLINKYVENIAFTYSKDMKKTQMFYSVLIDTSQVAETVREINPTDTAPARLMLNNPARVEYDS